MTTITDEQLQALVASARPYTIVILSWGPERDTNGVKSIIWEHGRRNATLRADGALPIVCPIGDETLAGLGIFDRDPDATREIMEGDPGVQAGVFTYELHATRSFPGDQLPA